MRLIIFFIAVLTAFQSFCNSFATIKKKPLFIKVKILSEFKPDVAEISILSGKYKLTTFVNKKKFTVDAEKNTSYTIKISNTKLELLINGKHISNPDSLIFNGMGLMNSFKLQTANMKRAYNDNLFIKPKKSSLFLINSVELEHYVAAVVEAESANKEANEEFYKVQAIICRTYTLRNLRKHLSHKYNLCDAEHCQVYKGKCTMAIVSLAVSKTAGKIILSKDNKVIEAAFHANCGGQTLNSEDVWTHPMPYLKTINDTFCIKSSKALWKKSIPKKEFLSYLDKLNINDTLMRDSLMRFSQTYRKSKFYDSVKLKELRTHFNLRSTYFTITPQNDSLMFSGRGNGHGIGLCQQGAQQMTAVGKTCEEVIKFYYKDVQIVNYYTTEKPIRL